MDSELEIIQHNQLNCISMLFNKINYRSPHMHREFELIYNLGGSTLFTVGPENVLLPENTFIICNPNQVHEIKSRSGSPFMICLQIAPEFFQAIYPDINHLEFDTFYLGNYKNEEIKKLILDLSYTYLKQEEGYEFLCASLVHTIFAWLLKNFGYHIMTDAEKKLSDEKTERINKILAFAQLHYTDKICLSDLAGELGLSPTYLSRFIKSSLNRTFQDYIGELRLTHARYLIRHTDKTLLSICEECGYSNYRYLYKAFMHSYGCSPKHYRTKNQDYGIQHLTYAGSSEELLNAEDTLRLLDEMCERL